ncbi:MAG: hypothetical protein M1820_000992 [Bogoriella megaspora]|nr:MAG: hypothetical protein M1820_000992 [Bogoriella megaspora]
MDKSKPEDLNGTDRSPASPTGLNSNIPLQRDISKSHGFVDASEQAQTRHETPVWLGSFERALQAAKSVGMEPKDARADVPRKDEVSESTLSPKTPIATPLPDPELGPPEELRKVIRMGMAQLDEYSQEQAKCMELFDRYPTLEEAEEMVEIVGELQTRAESLQKSINAARSFSITQDYYRTFLVGCSERVEERLKHLKLQKESGRELIEKITGRFDKRNESLPSSPNKSSTSSMEDDASDNPGSSKGGSHDEQMPDQAHENLGLRQDGNYGEQVPDQTTNSSKDESQKPERAASGSNSTCDPCQTGVDAKSGSVATDLFAEHDNQAESSTSHGLRGGTMAKRAARTPHTHSNLPCPNWQACFPLESDSGDIPSSQGTPLHGIVGPETGHCKKKSEASLINIEQESPGLYWIPKRAFQSYLHNQPPDGVLVSRIIGLEDYVGRLEKENSDLRVEVDDLHDQTDPAMSCMTILYYYFLRTYNHAQAKKTLTPELKRFKIQVEREIRLKFFKDDLEVLAETGRLNANFLTPARDLEQSPNDSKGHNRTDSENQNGTNNKHQDETLDEPQNRVDAEQENGTDSESLSGMDTEDEDGNDIESEVEVDAGCENEADAELQQNDSANLADEDHTSTGEGIRPMQEIGPAQRPATHSWHTLFLEYLGEQPNVAMTGSGDWESRVKQEQGQSQSENGSNTGVVRNTLEIRARLALARLQEMGNQVSPTRGLKRALEKTEENETEGDRKRRSMSPAKH